MNFLQPDPNLIHGGPALQNTGGQVSQGPMGSATPLVQSPSVARAPVAAPLLQVGGSGGGGGSFMSHMAPAVNSGELGGSWGSRFGAVTPTPAPVAAPVHAPAPARPVAHPLGAGRNNATRAYRHR